MTQLGELKAYAPLTMIGILAGTYAFGAQKRP
jgi:hypothetical protein